MITKFKIYENINQGEPEVGDWVIIDPKTYDVENRLDKIGEIYKYEISTNMFYVDFIVPGFFCFFKEDFEYWSKNKKDLEEILVAKKYNL